ncbi:MAG: DUF4340 domain-containing protein, partial [Gammaproteobacteria bacterium]|nr:DUF4340 domain-containing protein [Gammaproteobacteria bacterium]
NDVSSIILKQDKTTVSLLRKDNAWQVKEKNNYPADFSKIKSLLLNLRDLKTVEAKTSRPESYGRLGVQNPGESGDVPAKQLELFDKAGNKIVSVIIGKQKQAKVPGSKPAIYMRKTGDAKSWLVAGNLQVPTAVDDWLDKEIIDIKSSEIKSVSITHADHSRVLIAREKAEDKDFEVVNLPAKAKVKSSATVNGLANSLQSLSFSNIQPRESFDMKGVKPTVVDFETFKGLLIKVKLVELDKKYYLLLDVQSHAEDAATKAEAIKLGSHLAKWVFEVPEFKTTNMKKTMKDLIQSES